MVDVVIEKKRESFMNAWTEVAPKYQRPIIEEFKKQTGLKYGTFHAYRRGDRGISEEVADTIESIFKKFGYVDVWDY